MTSVDLLGPLYLQYNAKIYVVLFTCSVVRTVHLEIVVNVPIEFLMAFRRFSSRRGFCKIIYSNNSETFKIAENDLQQIRNLIKNPEVQIFLMLKEVNRNS